MTHASMFSMIFVSYPLLIIANNPMASNDLYCDNKQDNMYTCDTHDCNCDVKSKEDDEKIEHLAVATIANMAHNIVNIGNNPDDPKAVAKEVASIVANFTSFVMQAMKNPALLKVLEDDQFYKCIASRIRALQIKHSSTSNCFKCV